MIYLLRHIRFFEFTSILAILMGAVNIVNAQQSHDFILPSSTALCYSSINIIDLPYDYEEAESILHESILAESIEDRRIKLNDTEISVYDYLYFMKTKISIIERTVVETNKGDSLLQDLEKQEDLKKQELKNSTIVRDEHERIIKILVNKEQ